MIEPGRYRVPEDIPDALGEQAVAEGMAKREARFGEIFDRRYQSPAADAAETPVEQPAKRAKRGPKRRGKGKPAVDGTHLRVVG